MSKRIFPRFVYTRGFALMLLVAMLWLNFKALDVFHGVTRLPFVVFTTLGVLFLGRELLRGEDFLKDKPPARGPTHPQPPARHPAYLVVHLNTKQSPPVATFVNIYSSSARDLTRIGSEAHADLYVVEGNSFHEASDEMERLVPLYFPWAVPLMVRNR